LKGTKIFGPTCVERDASWRETSGDLHAIDASQDHDSSFKDADVVR
jgi:hypothetical protein